MSCIWCGVSVLKRLKPITAPHREMLQKLDLGTGLQFNPYEDDGVLRWICKQCEKTLNDRYQEKLLKPEEPQITRTEQQNNSVQSVSKSTTVIQKNEIQPQQQTLPDLTEIGQYYWVNNTAATTATTQFNNQNGAQKSTTFNTQDTLNDVDVDDSPIEVEAESSTDRSLSYYEKEFIKKNKQDYPQLQHFMDIPTSTKYLSEYQQRAASRNKNPNRFSYQNTYRKVEDHYVCNLCTDEPKKYTSEQTARRHIQLIHFGFRFICTECGLKYMNRRELEKHYQKKHNTIMPNVVETTSYDNPSIYQQIFKNKEHSARVSYRDSYKREHNYFICNHCKMIFISLANVVYHVKTYHFRVRYTCEQCGSEYTGRQQLKKHIEKIHTANQPTEIESDDDEEDEDAASDAAKEECNKEQKVSNTSSNTNFN